MNTADALLDFLRGPGFMFSLAVCVLGLGRLLFLHFILILTALYNARKASISYTAAAADMLAGIKAMAPGRSPAFFSLSKRAFLFTAFLLLPVSLPDHMLLINNIFGAAYPGISATAALWISLPAIVYLLIAAYKNCRDKREIKTSIPLLLATVVFATGVSAATTNHYASLKIFQILHALSGNLLLTAVPFSPLANFFLFPLTKITASLGTWSLPVVPTRNETLEYFKELKGKQ